MTSLENELYGRLIFQMEFENTISKVTERNTNQPCIYQFLVLKLLINGPHSGNFPPFLMSAFCTVQQCQYIRRISVPAGLKFKSPIPPRDRNR
jgi:hypothetical protein